MENDILSYDLNYMSDGQLLSWEQLSIGQLIDGMASNQSRLPS